MPPRFFLPERGPSPVPCAARIFLYLTALLVVGFAFHPRPGAAADQQITALGHATVRDGNWAVAREEALGQALHNGMQSYLVQRVGQEVAAGQFDLLMDKVLPQAVQQVQSYHVMAERRLTAGLEVLVQFGIDTDLVDAWLRQQGLLTTDGPPLRILFLVSETEGDTTRFWWGGQHETPGFSPIELALHTVFQGQGFMPVNRDVLPPSLFAGGPRATPELAEADILDAGRSAEADCVVYGHARRDPDGMMDLALRAYGVDSGRVVAQEELHAAVPPETDDMQSYLPFLETLVGRIATPMASALHKALAERQVAPGHFMVDIVNLKDVQDFVLVRSFLLRTVKGVTAVLPTRVEQTAIAAQVEFHGTADLLLERLRHASQPPLALTFVKETDDRIVIQIH